MSESITAIIVVVISSSITVIISIVTTLFDKKKHYSNVVVQYRMEWINKLYELGAQLIATLFSLDKKDNLVEREKIAYLKTSIILRLKPTDNAYDEEKRLIQLLQNDDYQIRESANEVRYLIQVICNKQWDKVKSEAGRKQ